MLFSQLSLALAGPLIDASDAALIVGVLVVLLLIISLGLLNVLLGVMSQSALLVSQVASNLDQNTKRLSNWMGILQLREQLRALNGQRPPKSRPPC